MGTSLEEKASTLYGKSLTTSTSSEEGSQQIEISVIAADGSGVVDDKDEKITEEQSIDALSTEISIISKSEIVLKTVIKFITKVTLVLTDSIVAPKKTTTKTVQAGDFILKVKEFLEKAKKDPLDQSLQKITLKIMRMSVKISYKEVTKAEFNEIQKSLESVTEIKNKVS